MAAGRRLLEIIPQLTRRTWEDVAPELERFLKRLWESESSGIPAGSGTSTPTTVEAGDTGSAGALTSGWAPMDHEHPVITGVPGGLDNTSQEGTSSALPRLDHKHKRDVRVKQIGADVGTRNALNFSADFTVADDAGNDEVDISLSAGGATLDDAYAFAFLGY
jgi:hypothetical protein